MRILKGLDGRELFLLPGYSYEVGRKGTDLILEGDDSISRKHAVVMLTKTGSECFLTDIKSKYGTFTKNAAAVWEELPRGNRKLMANGDVIRFGLLSQEWTLCEEPYVVSTSNLSQVKKATLKTTLAAIGAEFSAGWTTKCTHLTMSEVTLTVKAACALAQGRPIVTEEFWQLFKAMVERKQPAPRARDFIPSFVEDSITASRISLHVNEKRRTLFVGKCFVFANEEQLHKKGCLITSAGGKAVAFDVNALSLEELCQPQMILVHYFCNESQESLTEFLAAIEYSEAQGRRRIPESEIGMAILECSIERNCNPLFRPAASLIPTVSLETQTQSLARSVSASQVLAEETQESYGRRANKGRNIIIPESGSCSKDSIKKETQDDTMDMMMHQAEVVTDRNATARETRSRKRQGDSQLDESRAKKHTTVVDASQLCLSGEASSSIRPSMPVKVEDSADFLDFDSDTRHRCDVDEDDPFNFSKSGKTQNSLKRKSSVETRDVLGDDLFGSLTPKEEGDLKRVKMEEQARPDEFQEDEDLFSEDEQDNVQISSILSVTTETKLVDESACEVRSKKTIQSAGTDEDIAVKPKSMVKSRPVQKDRTVENENTLSSETNSSKMSKISLKGFLNTTVKVKKQEPLDMDDLKDVIKCLVVVQKKPLVVRREPAVVDASVSSSGLVNFKVFRKVAPLQPRQRISIDRSSVKFARSRSNSLSDEEENQVAKSQQCFNFVAKKRVR